MYNIEYKKAVYKDISRIDRAHLKRIKKAIEQKLQYRPEKHADRLKGELRNYWKLRTGNYRVIFKIEDKIIVVLGIIHRRDVYEDIKKRLAGKG